MYVSKRHAILHVRAEERRGGAGGRCASRHADGLEQKDTALAEKGAALAAAQAMLEEKVGALEEAKAEVSQNIMFMHMHVRAQKTTETNSWCYVSHGTVCHLRSCARLA